jgi:hypothetical protein
MKQLDKDHNTKPEKEKAEKGEKAGKGYNILAGRRVSRISEAEDEEAYVVENECQSRKGTNETLEDMDMDERECPVVINETKKTMKPLNATDLKSKTKKQSSNQVYLRIPYGYQAFQLEFPSPKKTLKVKTPESMKSLEKTVK